VPMRRPPISSLLALLAAVVATVLAAWTAVSGMDAEAALGGAVALVVPYVFIAIALSRASVWPSGLGVATAALMTWLTSFAVIEIVVGLPRQNPVRPASLPFVVLTIAGLGIVGFGLRDLFRALHATGYWTRTPAGARLGFVAVAYWALVFAADTYLTASPPPGRMLLAPSLLVIDLGAALMLRQPRAAAQRVGVLLATIACLATAAYWAAYSSYLTLGGGPPIVPDLTYFTRLPWPVLLTLSLALNLAIAAVGTRRLVARPLRVDP
jgi:hypothetical protein